MHKQISMTLAEILITLGIIGVVATMTIPSLIEKTNDAELKTAWKKEFSILSQATSRIENDNGGELQGVFTDSDQIKNIYKEYLINS